MEYVAKQYGDYVTMATFGVWAEACRFLGQRGADKARLIALP
jgi:hypothetical protein